MKTTIITAVLVLLMSFPALCQEYGQQQPVIIQQQRYMVPQQLYQEYQQTVTISPGRQVAVPMQAYPRPMMPRGVWYWGPFQVAYSY